MVLLPEPDGPMMATYSFDAMSRRHPPEREDPLGPHLVGPGQIPDPDHRASRRRLVRSVLGGVGLAHPVAVLEVADRLVGPAHDGLALAHPVQHLEVLVARRCPTLTGRKVAMPSRTTNTPSASRFRRLGLSVSAGGASTLVSLGTRSWSRTVSAMIGMLSALFRVSVTTRAVQLRSGRMSSGGSCSVISTSKSTARSLEPDAVWVGGELRAVAHLGDPAHEGGVRDRRRWSPPPSRRASGGPRRSRPPAPWPG